MRYLLDADVFIEAKNRFFRFTVCPGFWAWLESEHAAGRIFSIQAVKDDLDNFAVSDPLKQWGQHMGKKFFLEPDELTVRAMTPVADWANDTKQYTDAARDEFLAASDSWLVAAGLAHDDVVVTREQPSPASQKSIKIPDACNAHGVAWMDPFELMESLGATFIQPSDCP